MLASGGLLTSPQIAPTIHAPVAIVPLVEHILGNRSMGARLTFSIRCTVLGSSYQKCWEKWEENEPVNDKAVNDKKGAILQRIVLRSESRPE